MYESNDKKIVIHGCYDFHNFGDMLILDMIRHALRDMPDIECACPWERVCISGNVRNHGRGWWDVLSAHAGVFGGGGYLFAGARSWRYYLPARIWQARGIPYIIIGVGAGPQMDPAKTKWVRALCEGATTICVRDQESKQLLQEIGIPEDRVHATADIVLGLEAKYFPSPAVAAGEKTLAAFPRGKRLLGLHFHNACGPLRVSSQHPFYARDLSSKFVELTKGLSGLLRMNRDVQLVWLFDDLRGGIWGSKLRTVRTLCERSLPEMRYMPYYDPWSAAYCLGRLHGVITTKLHVGIAAWAQGVPCCAYAYHGKIARFYRQIGRSRFCVDDSAPVSTILDWVRTFIEDPTDFAREDQTAHARLRFQANRNIKLLRAFVDSVRAKT
jgi:polysaccharide pyruvyl transferase WcaK-like protein